MILLKHLVEFWQKNNIAHAKKTICKALSSKNNLPFDHFYFYDVPLKEEDLLFLEDVLKRILEKEPLSKILGESSFYGRTFKINQHVLDPRPDTEKIIDGSLTLLDPKKTYTFLDLGTGSGCLAITLLLEFPLARAVAVDLSNDALIIAQNNAKLFNVEDRLTLFKSDWFTNVPEHYEQGFDLIVSNPPYIKENYHLDKSVLAYDPPMALFSGEDGLFDYRKIFSNLSRFLKKDGIFFGEIGFDQSDSIQKELMNFKCLKFKKIYKDLSSVDRVIEIGRESSHIA